MVVNRNLNTPAFDRLEYDLTLSENQRIQVPLLKLLATDLDRQVRKSQFLLCTGIVIYRVDVFKFGNASLLYSFVNKI